MAAKAQPLQECDTVMHSEEDAPEIAINFNNGSMLFFNKVSR